MVDWKQIGLLIVVVVLLVAPLVYYNGSTDSTAGAFGGSDDQGSDAVTQVDPSYKIWAQPIWEPPSGEIESFLFALQAAIGAIIIGYVFGRWHGANIERKRRSK
jgi:cobalt/nickel transport protein